MTRRLLPVALITAPFVLAGCATAVPPVEVTRFHTPALASLASGTAYQFDDSGATGIEATSYRIAVDQQLRRIGFVPAVSGAAAPLRVRVTLDRRDRTVDERAPVSIGVGGSTGSYGSGLGVGIGFNFGGGARQWTDLTLAVRIDDSASGTALWEGRAQTAVPQKAPAAQPSLAAAKMAQALFEGFPGQTGTTISVP